VVNRAFLTERGSADPTSVRWGTACVMVPLGTCSRGLQQVLSAESQSR
jgi:hypothetical protein